MGNRAVTPPAPAARAEGVSVGGCLSQHTVPRGGRVPAGWSLFSRCVTPTPGPGGGLLYPQGPGERLINTCPPTAGRRDSGWQRLGDRPRIAP